jgi:hypothetical protein
MAPWAWVLSSETGPVRTSGRMGGASATGADLRAAGSKDEADR